MPANPAPHRTQTPVLQRSEAPPNAILAIQRPSISRSRMHPGVYKLAALCWAIFMAVVVLVPLALSIGGVGIGLIIRYARAAY